MDVSRRKLFGIGAAAIAAATIPVGAIVIEKSDNKTVGPILLERICDGGRSEMTAEEIRKWEADMREIHGGELSMWFPGCGTKFQWYHIGGYPCCPNCGRAYQMTIEMLKSGKYTVKS